jgi:hypothetical protein
VYSPLDVEYFPLDVVYPHRSSMAKASKPKCGAAAGVKAKLPSTKEKGKARAPPAVVDDSDDDCKEVVAVEARTSKRLVVKWDDDRTTRLLDWLDQHPDDRNRLFSDSTVAAKQEGRRKVTAKGNKTRYHEALAKAVFDSPDEEPSLRIWYLREPGKFTTSVLNYLSRCVGCTFIHLTSLMCSFQASCPVS